MLPGTHGPPPPPPTTTVPSFTGSPSSSLSSSPSLPASPPPVTSSPPTGAPASSSPGATPTATANLLLNSSFDSGGISISPWYYDFKGKVQGAWSLASSTTADAGWSVKLTVTMLTAVISTTALSSEQDNLVLRSNQQYTVTFWAKASASRKIYGQLQQAVSPYH